jgi:hypothetical protein
VVPRISGRNYAPAFQGETRDYVYYLVVHVANNTMGEKRGRSAGYWLEWPTGVAIKDKEGEAQRFATAEEAADALKNNWAEYAARYNPSLHSRLEQPRPSWATTVVAKPVAAQSANKGWMERLWQGMNANQAVPANPENVPSSSRLNLVLALGQQHLEATGCMEQAHLGGERAPCGVVVFAPNAGGAYEMAIVTSKSKGSLGCCKRTFVTKDAADVSATVRAAQLLMNAKLSGPYYGNIYLSTGLSVPVSVASAKAAVVNLIESFNATPLVDGAIGPGVEAMFAHVRDAVRETLPDGAVFFAAPFLSR